MIVMWKTSSYWDTRIERVECERVTDKSVWVVHEWSNTKETRRHPREGGDTYHETWEAARQHLLTRAEQSLATARRALQLAQATHGNVKGMKPPAEAA